MASGGGHVNGVSREPDDGGGHHLVSDDMLFKLSKKIAQLTKVIYTLNTKNDDLEFDMENMRHSYEDKLEKVSVFRNILKEVDGRIQRTYTFFC